MDPHVAETLETKGALVLVLTQVLKAEFMQGMAALEEY